MKLVNSGIGFFQKRKLTIYKITSVRKSYTFQSLLKDITLLPAENFGNIKLYQQTVLLKIINEIEIFDFKKAPFRYVFSIAIMYSCETVWHG